MYLQHFKMNAQPFVEQMPVEHIFRDERIAQGLTRLQYLLHGGTIALITGYTGVGKSSLLKLFLGSLSGNHYTPVYIHITHIKTTSLLKLIVSGMGEIPKNTKERLFGQIFDKTQRSEATAILIIDEAHLLPSEALTDLRLLVSSALDEAPPLKIILSGQESLRKQLKRSCLLDLAQRISVHYHLPSLTQTQTHAYIDHQLHNAGASDKIFEPEAKTLIHEYSNGIPRQINNLATASLIQAVAQNAQKINRDILAMAIRECQL